jgi:putative hydrolase of HD superfamily
MANIFDHILKRDLAHVTRFNNRPQHFPESVAEHSFYVAYFVLIICNLLEKRKIKVDSAKAMKMALIHDSEETVSGDILSPFKNYNDEVYEAIRQVNKVLIKEIFDGLPSDLEKDLISLWKEENRAKSMEAQVVKIADKLSLLSKCFEEIQAGNHYFEEIYKWQLSKLKKIDYPWWQEIREEILEGAEKQL